MSLRLLVGDFYMLAPSSGCIVVKPLRHQAAFGTFASLKSDLITVLSEATRTCVSTLEIPLCGICCACVAENDFLIEASWCWHSDVVGQVVARVDKDSPQGWAYVTGKPVIIHNRQTVDNMTLPGFHEEHGIVSAVDLVIQAVNGIPYGSLEIDSTSQHQHDMHDVNFLTSFANGPMTATFSTVELAFTCT